MPGPDGEETPEEETPQEETLARVRAAEKRSNKAAKDAVAELAEVRGKLREREVADAFRTIGVKMNPARYPQELETTEEAIKGYLKDEMGFDQETITAWGRIDRMREVTEGSQRPPSQPDELGEYIQKNEKELRKVVDWYSKPEEFGPAGDSWQEYQRLQAEYGPKVARGEEKSAIRPEGWGGLSDPPLWAQTWRKHPANAGLGY